MTPSFYIEYGIVLSIKRNFIYFRRGNDYMGDNIFLATIIFIALIVVSAIFFLYKYTKK